MAIQFKSATGFDYVSAATPLPVTIVGGSGGPFVLKAGDTMTGNLVVQSNSVAIGTAFTPVAWGTGGALDVNGAAGGLVALYYGGAAKGYFLANSTSGFSFNTQGDGSLNFVTNGTERGRFDANGLVMSGAVRLNNAAVAATPTATHTVTMEDSTGQVYRFLCAV
jgi:hypothetical protein